ncbi:MAG: uncharacterized protein K0Q83_3243 [Deltaproteobacteria bacterium]|nr:uncharacterized protein [Deltaproteobacteria bacterium]
MKTIATTKFQTVQNDNNPRLWRSIERPIVKSQVLLNRVLATALLAVVVLVPVGQTAQAQSKSKEDLFPPTVFQAAGSTADSIQSTVDAFRAALGNPNNGNNPPPLDRSGRREINWDGGNPNIVTTTPPVTPFNTFLDSRGAQFTTPGLGLSQGPTSGGPEGGLAALFNNPTYETIFSTFSPSRLFTPVGSNVTEALFFLPGSNGTVPAAVRGFGAVFTDVDQPDGSGPSKKRGNRGASTLIEYFGANDKVLFSSFVPASPGDASLSFFAIVFDEPLITRVRITTGDTAPGPDDDVNQDIVMMDDFIYGEPQPLY